MTDASVRPSQQPESERILEELGIVREPRNPFHLLLEQLLEAAEAVGLKHHQKLILAQPKSEIMVHFPVLMDDGRHRLFKGYRVQHNNALGPFKGGLRFHPRLSLDETKALAVLTTLKCSLLRLPFGGAMGGVKCNPGELSEGEVMRLTRRFASALSHYVGPDYDVVEPDIGTDGRTMAWFADTLVQTTADVRRQEMIRAVTGKPVEMGGSFGRDRAVGQGLVDVLAEMLPEVGVDFAGGRFIAVGFGTVGSWAARQLAERGMTLVAALDHTGAIWNETGIDPFLLQEHVMRRGGIEGFAAANVVPERDVWAVPADILVAAATDGLIDAERASRISARVIVEGGHLPITREGSDVLLARGVETLPSILCGAGGVVASYLEWVQNRLSTTWSGEEVDEELRRAMTLAARRVKLARIRYECDWRTASMCAACERLGRVYDLRGVFP
ncbi:MAG: Glu/Leu/Phe/Val dehydrogenase [Phycisphaerales bacterium]